VVIAEALDRISRSLRDTDKFFDVLAHHDIRLVTIAEGDITDLHVGMKGTMNKVFLKDLGLKTRRGQEGRVAQGRAGGGISYGYRKVPLNERGEVEDGLREIVDSEAEVIRRIFRDYDAGLSARAIAAALNREGIRSPRGGQWNASSINGNPRRLDGILLNRLYIGQIVFGRHAYRKNPETGRRETRTPPEGERKIVEVPSLRIVDQDLWGRVQARRNATIGVPQRLLRRPKHLLSGLVRCECGGPFAISNSERMACTHRRERGTCTNNHTIRVDDLENRVLGALKERLLAPEVFAEYAREFRAELKRLRDESGGRRETLQREIAEATTGIGRLVDAIVSGTDSPALRERLAQLERDRARLQDELETITAAEREVVDLHPGLPDFYRGQIASLEAALRDAPHERARAAEIIRPLINKVIVHPTPWRGVTKLTIESSVGAVLDFAHRAQQAAQEHGRNALLVQVVPRAGIGQNQQFGLLRISA
jgi:site-specific DNA recombinase